MIKIHGDTESGNCYKIRLLTALLDIPHQWLPVDILAGETRTPAFLALNPAGQIPVLELDDGRVLSESNAILRYLAEGSDFWPQDAYTQARVLQWQFFEQYSHEPYIAVARFIQHYLGLPEERREEYARKHEGGYRALDVMERQLARTPWLVGDKPTLADISLFAYTHVADEGGFDLSDYPAITAWIARIEALPGFLPMRD